MKVAAVVLAFSLAGCSGRWVGLEPHPAERPSTSRPELRWEPLPADAFGPPFAISEVCYDLRVFEGGTLVYSREGLSEPRHRIERTLTPGTTYTWTVRARFRIDGGRRLTDWTQQGTSGRRDGNVVRDSASLVPLTIEPLPKP